MRKALDMAYSVLSSARSNATKYLFLLTDGEPDADPSAEADRIKFNVSLAKMVVARFFAPPFLTGVLSYIK